VVELFKSVSTLILCPLVGTCVILSVPHKYSHIVQGLTLVIAGIHLMVAMQMYTSSDIPVAETIKCYPVFTHKNVIFDFTSYSVI